MRVTFLFTIYNSPLWCYQTTFSCPLLILTITLLLLCLQLLHLLFSLLFFLLMFLLLMTFHMIIHLPHNLHFSNPIFQFQFLPKILPELLCLHHTCRTIYAPTALKPCLHLPLIGVILQFFALSSVHQQHIHQLDYLHEPCTYKEDVVHSHWVQAMRAEIAALKANKTWLEVSLPPGKKAIISQWVFKVKLKADGSLEMYKARLVVKGNIQKIRRKAQITMRLFLQWLK